MVVVESCIRTEVVETCMMVWVKESNKVVVGSCRRMVGVAICIWV